MAGFSKTYSIRFGHPVDNREDLNLFCRLIDADVRLLPLYFSPDPAVERQKVGYVEIGVVKDSFGKYQAIGVLYIDVPEIRKLIDGEVLKGVRLLEDPTIFESMNLICMVANEETERAECLTSITTF